MIWDHDDLRYIYSMNYSEKEGLRKKWLVNYAKWIKLVCYF